MEAPNPKHQISNKSQVPKFEAKLFGHLKLEFGACLACLREAAPAKAGIWNL
jgi:hypothetical protein